MNRNAQVLSFLAVVFAVALLMLFLEPDPGAGALDPRIRDAQEAALNAGRHAESVAAGESVDEVERTAETTFERTPDLASGDTATMTIRVVDDATSEPVANAVVHLVDTEDRERGTMLEKFEAEPDAVDFLRKNGRSLRTDGKGEAVILQPEGWVIACALKGDLFAMSIIGLQQPADVLELRLIPDVTLHLRVVDESGKGVAGVPVALQTRARNWSQSGSKRVTGGDGRAAFPHAQVRLASAPSRSTCWLAVSLPSKPMAEVLVDVDAEDLEEEKVVTLARGGKVTVRVLDIDGRPFPRPVDIHLQSYDSESGVPKRFTPHAKDGHTVATTIKSEAVFERIGAGLQLVVAAQLDGSKNWFVGTGAGPVSVDEPAVIEIRQNVQRPELVFHLVDPDGEPLASIDVNCVQRDISEKRSSDRSRRLKTDALGVLRYTLSSGPLGTLQARALEIRYKPSRNEPEWRASADLSQDYPMGSHDLGSLTMTTPRLLAAGEVVAPGGQSVGGAEVKLYVKREDSRPGRIRWRLERGTETQTSPDGSFEIYGPPSGLAMELRATHPDYLQGKLPGISGGTEHSIILDAGRSLEGRVEVDDPAMYDHLAVSFIPEGAEAGVGRSWSRGSRRVGVDPDGSFEFAAMQTQRGNLRITDMRNSVLLHQINAVEPWLDGTRPDGRLDPIDLRGQIDVLQLSFTDIAGDPIKEARYSVTLPGSEEAWWGVARSGEAELFVPPGGVDILVRTNGYREQTLYGVVGDRTIRLETAIQLRFELRPATLAREYDLEIRTRGIGDGPSVQPSVMRFSKSSSADATAPRAGTVQVFLRVRWKNENGGTQARYVNFGSLGRRLDVEIHESTGVQIVPIQINRADIQAAIGQ